MDAIGHDVPVDGIILGDKLVGDSPPPNGTKYYARTYILRLADDEAWLARASDALVKVKWGKNHRDGKEDATLRRQLEQTRLGRRVLCTDQHHWSTERIVYAFRGQWNVEELFRRAKRGGVVPWGPSHQWGDGSLRLHTLATVLGLMLVSLPSWRWERTLPHAQP